MTKNGYTKHLFSYVEFKDFFDNMDTYVKDYEKNKRSSKEIAKQIALEFV